MLSTDQVLKQLLKYLDANVRAELEQLLCDVDDQFFKDQMYLCVKSLAVIEEKLGSVGLGYASSTSQSQNHQTTPLGARLVIQYLRQSRIYREAHHKVQKCDALMEEMTSPQWEAVRKGNKEGEGTFYMAEPSLGTHSFKVVGTVKASLFNLAAILLELDLYKEWFPFCNFSCELGSLGRFHKLAKYDISLPWPVANREVVVCGFGVDCLENRRVIISAKSVEDGKDMGDGNLPPPVGKGNVRAIIYKGGFLLDYLSPDTTKISFMINVDPLLPAAPYWLLNFVSGKMIWVLVWQMERAASFDERSKYAKRMKERGDVYDFMKKRAAEMAEQLGDPTLVAAAKALKGR